MYDWNDLRHFLAVARTGSTLAASRVLGVNQTTAARRVSVLEKALGMKLFDRRQAGYTLTEDGQELLAAAERVEVEANAFAAEVGAIGRRVSGVIRVTTAEGLANVVLVPALRAFRQLHPEVRIDLVVDERRLDLARGAADVALRTGPRPTEHGLVGRRLIAMGWAAYCSRDYAERQGCPGDVDSLCRHAVIGAEGAIASLPGWTWLQQAAPEAEVVARSSSITNMISAVKAGLGVSVLPCVLADSDPALVRCMGPIEGARSDLWLLTREELRKVPRIRVFLDFVAAHIADMRHLLAGDAAPVRSDEAAGNPIEPPVLA
jgi:DNA-binding transcriptional LysR family regulator